MEVWGMLLQGIKNSRDLFGIWMNKFIGVHRAGAVMNIQHLLYEAAKLLLRF